MLATLVLGVAPAWADDGSTALPPELVVPAVDDALAETDVDAITEAVVEDALEAMEPPADDQSAVADVPDTGAGEGGEESAIAPAASDTAAAAVDTADDTSAVAPHDAPETAQAATPPTPVTVGVQATPGNLNVSVRVASPGDGGTMEQTSVTGSAPKTAGPAVGTPDAAASAKGTPSPGAVVSSAEPTAVSSLGSAPTWTWEWNCLSLPSVALYPTTIDGGIAPSSWIWYWNCGDNQSQYQPGNINVAIRIASPGSDGPVTQTNVVVVAQTPRVVVDAGAGRDAPWIALAPPPIASIEISGPVAVPALPVEHLPPALPVTSPIPDGGVQELPPALEADVAPSHGATPFLPGLSFSSATSRGPDRRRLAPETLRPRALGLVVIRRIPAVPAVTTESSPAAHSSGSARTKAVERASRWRPPAPRDADIGRVSSGASVAPAGPGGSGSGGLPLFLALPFLAAVLDMARRFALERVATPLGHRSRAPHDPG